MSKNKIYTVWFDQVNAQRIDVIARSEGAARVKAEAVWKRECAPASIRDIRKREDEP